ncbi:cobalamin-binding protein [Candidatus Magnetomorum sp. HK-1]|nr:cobalamin-binding protein [Candidatus Magnetomorum sp. HK-1]
MNEDNLQNFIKAIVDGDQALAISEVENLLSNQVSKQTIITDGIEPAMMQLDNRCTAEHYNLLELMLAGRAVDAVTKILFPDGLDSKNTKGKIIVASLEGDVHDLGKNIVKKVLMGKGYYVIDCGKDTLIEKLINTAKRENVIAICISGLITSVIPQVQQLKDRLKGYELDNIHILAGGAALKQSNSGDLKVDYVGDTVFDAVHYIEKIAEKGMNNE